MAAPASDRTAYLRYCNTTGSSSTSACVCCPKMVGIDPSNNTVCLDPACSSITADLSGQSIALDLMDNGTGDAFGRLRISQPYTLFEFNSISGKQPLFIDEQVTGVGASATWKNGDSYIEMSVPATVGASVIRQSHDYIPYQPGKSRLVLMTGVLIENQLSNTSVTTRIGTYDTTIGGVYIQFSNGVFSVNLANLLAAVPSTRTAVRSNSPPPGTVKWDDLLDGSGPSGVLVDFSKAQIFMFDFEWLGVGQVRCGVIVNGRAYYYYTFTNLNFLTIPYIPTAKLPLRYEIISNGSANKMRMMCGTIISEGGFSPPGNQFILSTDNTASAATLTNSNLFRPVLGLSLRTTSPYNRGTIKLEEIDIFVLDSNIAGSWKVLLNPTMTYDPTSDWTNYGPPNVDISNNSIARYFRAPKSLPFGTPATPIITNEGIVLYQGYFSQRTNYRFSTTIDELVASKGIASNISGTPDVFVLVINWLVGSNNTEVYSAVRWAEII